MYLVRMCACMMWFAVWQLNGAQSQLTVEVREYTSSAKTSYKTLRTYSDPSGAPPLQDWFTARYVNIPDVFSNNTGFSSRTVELLEVSITLTFAMPAPKWTHLQLAITRAQYGWL